MYAFIKGKLDSLGEGFVVIDNNGIGYNIQVSNDVLHRLSGKIAGEEVKLYTYTNVKEDAFELFGFDNLESKNMFIKLIAVSGVGCRSALQILSGMDTASLAVAIAEGDVKALSSVKGIGKKTAERIIVELKEKVDVTDLKRLPLFGASIPSDDTVSDEAVLALVALGINKNDAVRAVAKARESADTTEKVITLALRSLN